MVYCLLYQNVKFITNWLELRVNVIFNRYVIKAFTLLNTDAYFQLNLSLIIKAVLLFSGKKIKIVIVSENLTT